jgi:NAD(P)-dependent dehydrogenase (short-subunit alcohol dehydrogenase family)
MRILITGSARAIGAATAEELTRAGHQVIATARDIALLDHLDVAMRVPLDVTDDASISNALAQAGDIDAIVNNAALSGKGPIEEFPIDRLREMFETNTFGPIRLLQHVLPRWRERGSGVVVNVSSVQGKVATPLEGPYVGTKHALEGMSESLHYELGHFGIRVVLIQPGYIAPGMKPAEKVGAEGPYRELWEQWTGHDAKVTGPQGRSGPEVVAQAIRTAIEDPSTPLRVPVGNDAVFALNARAQLADADFEAAMRTMLDMTW